jgi:hypothetical protein
MTCCSNLVRFHHKSIFIFGVPKQIFKKLREAQYVVVLNLCTKVEDHLYTRVHRPADEDSFLRIYEIFGGLLHFGGSGPDLN